MKNLFTFQQALKSNDHPVMSKEMSEYCMLLVKASQPEESPTSLVPGEQARNPRIKEQFGLEWPFKGHLVQPSTDSREISNSVRLPRASNNLTWNGPRDGVFRHP